jgi:hypothetical protein
MKEKKKNVFWFIIDSVRTFRTGVDDRDRIDIMDQFAKDSIEFTNCYTSAPSSLLAAGAMFSGLPSTFVARHFNDWKFKDNNLSTIKTLVQEHGYTSIPLIDGRSGREKYQNLIPPFPSSYLPKGKHLHDYAWTNKEVTEIFEHIISNKKFEDPFAFVFWYDCRRDSNTSKHVAKAINLIKEHGYYNDSIIIMNSDHGYPDPRTKLNEGFFKELGHDMVLTEDNIKTPLILKYPGSPQNVELNNVVGHIDIIPTIYDLLKIKLDKNKDNNYFRGKSLLSIINEKEGDDKRVIRTDTRLQMDNGRITSFRSSQYKYIYFHDDNHELLFDLLKDPMELTNLLPDKPNNHSKVLKSFIALKLKYEEELFNFHKSELIQNADNSFKNLKLRYKGNQITILVITVAPDNLIEMLSNYLKKTFETDNIILIKTKKEKEFKKVKENIYHTKELSEDNIRETGLSNLDIIIYLTHNSRRVFLKDNIVKSIKKIKAKEKLLLNYNFELFEYFSYKSFFTYFKLFFNWEIKGYFYKQEPIYFFKDLYFYIKHTFTILSREKQRQNNDLMSAREIYAYRSHQLKSEKAEQNQLSNNQLDYEVKRIEEWGDE